MNLSGPTQANASVSKQVVLSGKHLALIASMKEALTPSPPSKVPKGEKSHQRKTKFFKEHVKFLSSWIQYTGLMKGKLG